MNKFNTADLCDDYKLVVARPIFKSFGSHTHCYGKIKTVEAIEDNSYVKKLLQEDGSGCVMVVDGKGSEKCALVFPVELSIIAPQRPYSPKTGVWPAL